MGATGDRGKRNDGCVGVHHNQHTTQMRSPVETSQSHCAGTTVTVGCGSSILGEHEPQKSALERDPHSFFRTSTSQYNSRLPSC